MMNPRPRLQVLLALDAATCAAMGALLLAGSGPVAALTGLPRPMLLWAGAVLLPIAAFMAIFSRAHVVPRWAATFVVLGNVGWVVASLALPIAELVQPNGLGWAFLLGQAAVVALLAKLELGAARTPAASRLHAVS